MTAGKRWYAGMIWLAMAALVPAALPRNVQMETLEADSSFIQEASFEWMESEEAGVLRVRLGKDVEFIRYFEVPVSVWEAFKAAESKGSFYATEIRQKYERLYGRTLGEKFDSPFPVQTEVNAVCAFNGECEDLILQSIEKSQTSIWVAAYAFTRSRIAAALVRAHKRGVQVEMKMDVNQAEHPGARRLIAWLRQEGISVTLIYTAGDYAAMHNKFMVFDLRWVVTGSYNFTTQAQVVNWENLVWMESPVMAEQYKMAWDAIVSDQAAPKSDSTEVNFQIGDTDGVR
ncbi:MAG: phospholipase D-like domain-containing protein [Verrucomicrobiota bacterium]|jgi:phosphatidylserine/phosphatidylglycerophosphate/cardiolipin synthase-like enzyme|nr:phospholipase D-like domain-containing protein [Verrucomicrobiota bacterium]